MKKTFKNILATTTAGLMLAASVMAQDTNRTNNTSNDNQSQATSQQSSGQMARVSPGQKQKIKGVIIRRDADSFIMRDPASGSEYQVGLSNNTKVEERKSNPFRGAKNYGVTSLLRGLNVEVEGRGDNSGMLMAEKIKTRESDLAVARTVESRVTPVEGRVTDAEGRLTAAESNAQRLSGQIDELQAISNAARGGAKAAQETADAAIAGVNSTNERISSLDDYDARKAISVNFKVNSFKLSPEAMAALDAIAQQAKTEKGYVIEVSGHASSDGKLAYNRHLSQERADAVVRYLAENHNIPLRRIITPFGYGVAQPVADNSTREGREQNRRVDVKILVSKGLTAPVNISSPNSNTTNTDTQRQRSVSQSQQEQQ
ncbi:MAG TPA: OmpA family protein [Blastocatellia bacterium]|nr:OmpA family protein [Blastocatellia bacterium]